MLGHWRASFAGRPSLLRPVSSFTPRETLQSMQRTALVPVYRDGAGARGRVLVKVFYFDCGPLFRGPLVIEARHWREAKKIARAWWESNGIGSVPDWRKPL